MNIIPPLLIGESNLLSSNIANDEIPLWDATTSYSRGDEVTYERQIWQSVIAIGETSTGDTPGDISTTPPKWQNTGFSNRWKAFDGRVSDKAKSSNTFVWDGTDYNGIYYEILPGEIYDTLIFFGVVASRIFIRTTDPVEGVIYDKEIDNISNDGVDNWYSYFFSPIESTSDVIYDDLPSYRQAKIEIGLVTESGADAEVSEIVIGSRIEIGCTRFGPRFGILDFSVKERDDFGNDEIMERGFSKSATFDVRIERNRVDYVQRILSRYRAKPVVYNVLDGLESSLIYGFYRDFEVILPNINVSRCQIEVEGLNQE